MTSPININVQARYLDQESQPQSSRYVYAYTISIENNGEEATQLISRYWKIIDSNESVQEVQGIGVVGEQPTLQPGESYQYTSGVVLETESGLMEGFYRMRSHDGSEYDTVIPTFALVKPSALH